MSVKEDLDDLPKGSIMNLLFILEIAIEMIEDKNLMDEFAEKCDVQDKKGFAEFLRTKPFNLKNMGDDVVE